MRVAGLVAVAMLLAGCQTNETLSSAEPMQANQAANNATAVRASYLVNAFWAVCTQSAPKFGNSARNLLRAQSWSKLQDKPTEVWGRAIQATEGPLVRLLTTVGPTPDGRQACQMITEIVDPAALDVALQMKVSEDKTRAFARNPEGSELTFLVASPGDKRWLLKATDRRSDDQGLAGLFAISVEQD